VIVWTAVVVPSGIARSVVGWQWRFLAEAAAYLGLLVLITSCRPVVDAVRGVGPRATIACGVLAAALLTAQLAPVERMPPFLRFAMYTKARGDISEYDLYQGTLSSGRHIVVRPDTLFPALTHGRMASRVTELTRDRSDGDRDAAATLQDLLRAIGEEWNRSHRPSEQIRRLDLIRYSLPLSSLPVARAEGTPIAGVGLAGSTP
jgi:hypothetical protein